jgi:hypothetical protein
VPLLYRVRLDTCLFVVLSLIFVIFEILFVQDLQLILDASFAIVVKAHVRRVIVVSMHLHKFIVL